MGTSCLQSVSAIKHSLINVGQAYTFDMDLLSSKTEQCKSWYKQFLWFGIFLDIRFFCTLSNATRTPNKKNCCILYLSNRDLFEKKYFVTAHMLYSLRSLIYIEMPNLIDIFDTSFPLNITYKAFKTLRGPNFLILKSLCNKLRNFKSVPVFNSRIKHGYEFGCVVNKSRLH